MKNIYSEKERRNAALVAQRDAASAEEEADTGANGGGESKNDSSGAPFIASSAATTITSSLSSTATRASDTKSATASAAAARVHLIQPWHVVLGDTHARDHRTTAATQYLRSLKERYKVDYKGGKKARWIPLAVAEFQKDLPTLFAKKEIDAIAEDDLGRVLIKCTTKALEGSKAAAERIIEPNCYQYEGDETPTYGTAKWKESIEFFLASRDAPTLASELARHWDNLRKLQTARKRPPATMLHGFEKTLHFFSDTLQDANAGDNTLAEKLLESLKPINSLKEQWKMLESHCREVVPGEEEDNVESVSRRRSGGYSPRGSISSSTSSSTGNSSKKPKFVTGVPTYRKHHHTMAVSAATRGVKRSRGGRTSPGSPPPHSIELPGPPRHQQDHPYQLHHQQSQYAEASMMMTANANPVTFSMSQQQRMALENGATSRAHSPEHSYPNPHSPSLQSSRPSSTVAAASMILPNFSIHSDSSSQTEPMFLRQRQQQDQFGGGAGMSHANDDMHDVGLDNDHYQDPIAPPDDADMMHAILLQDAIMEQDVPGGYQDIASILPADWEWNESPLPSRTASPQAQAQESGLGGDAAAVDNAAVAQDLPYVAIAQTTETILEQDVEWASLLDDDMDDQEGVPKQDMEADGASKLNVHEQDDRKPKASAYSPAWMFIKIAAVASALGLRTFKGPSGILPPKLVIPSHPVDLPNLPDPVNDKDLSCPQDEVCANIMEALYPVFPEETFPLIGVPGSCQNWAREWLRGNKDVEDFTVERIRQRYAMAMLYCETGGEEWVEQGLWVSEMHECDWDTEITIDPCNRNEQVQIIRNHGQQMRGTLPPELSMMSALWEITLSDNLLTGSIPSEYVKLSQLDTFSLSYNLFAGPIPDVLWGYEDMMHLDVSYNFFSGSLPDNLHLSMPTLRDLLVDYNALNGTIPESFGMMNWQRLHLNGNKFHGTIPDEINAGKLRELMLHNNQFTGTFPAESFATEWSGRRSKLETVTLYENKLQGDVNVMCKLMTDSRIGKLDTFEVDLDRMACDCCSKPP